MELVYVSLSRYSQVASHQDTIVAVAQYVLYQGRVGTDGRANVFVGGDGILQGFQSVHYLAWHVGVGYQHYAARKYELS